MAVHIFNNHLWNWLWCLPWHHHFPLRWAVIRGANPAEWVGQNPTCRSGQWPAQMQAGGKGLRAALRRRTWAIGWQGAWHDLATCTWSPKRQLCPGCIKRVLANRSRWVILPRITVLSCGAPSIGSTSACWSESIEGLWRWSECWSPSMETYWESWGCSVWIREGSEEILQNLSPSKGHPQQSQRETFYKAMQW